MPTHGEQRLLPYPPRQLYELVADVGRYPEFLPWCVAARVREHDERHVVADLVIGFRMVRERFTSKVALRDEPGQPLRIDVAYVEGPFRYLNNHWIFIEQPDGGTLIDFFVDFEFRSKLLQTMIQPLFNEAVRRMVGAFETRARHLYGGGAG
ncbi:coenzyme Q-binding protein COQ10 [Tistlia consotensis]|uniref:Coenzyme Q-binding protein COQ10 n=1 Tax=Tistlia consotensis USBA 355 TaxID=560819 RepID=A0A1Y6BRK5_9PROT|nr:type II toxin-antitoxin system RatA family toxin [Tistlia consotensis]SMF25257.1 coenzyme Q-binding protein COQ10 [Tistlia consotensis USBA 355]SNR59666.1 coenzyme Q-binding protein COQ10 [Tistlia consotensis]